jgi:hypothetical protein
MNLFSGKPISHKITNMCSLFFLVFPRTPTVVLVVLGVVRPTEAGAEAKVCELDVTVGVDEDVVRLDVAVDEAHFVDALHCAHQLTDVKPKQQQNPCFLCNSVDAREASSNLPPAPSEASPRLNDVLSLQLSKEYTIRRRFGRCRLRTRHCRTTG